MARKVRRQVRLGRKIGTSAEWDALAGSVAALARNYRATVAVCINTRGEVSIVIGGDGTRLSPVAVIEGAEDRARIETTWQLRQDGYALYRQAVPAFRGRPSDKVGSRTAPRLVAAPGPVAEIVQPGPIVVLDEEQPPVGIEDGPAYTEEEKAALRAFLEGED